MGEQLAQDMLTKAVKQVGRLRKVDMRKHQLRSEQWDKVARTMVKLLDEMKGHGAQRPLAKLQDLAFAKSMERPDERHLQTVSLWLTDTRIHVEYHKAGDDRLRSRELLERRGILKPARPKKASEPEPEPDPDKESEPESEQTGLGL